MDQSVAISCDSPACGQRFTSTAALALHKKKQNLCLKLATDVSHVLSLPLSSATSTREELPTPCRFLKEFERNSSFLDDIVDGSKSATPPTVSPSSAENPFAPEFRRYSTSKRPEIPAVTVQEPDSESLNTPSILFNNIGEHPLAAVRHTPPAENIVSPVISPLHSFSIKKSVDNEKEPTKNANPDSESKSCGNESAATAASTELASHTVAAEVPQLTSHTKPNCVVLPLIQPVPVPIGPVKVVPLSSGPRVIRVIKVATSSSGSNQLNTNSVSCRLAPKPLAPKSQTVNEPVTLTPPETKRQKVSERNKSKPSKSVMKINDEEKQNVRDRNREAAKRFRDKKKQSAEQKEKHANNLSRMNQELQKEVTQLRQEVMFLKTALLAHKNCPVTLQQLRLTSHTTRSQ